MTNNIAGRLLPAIVIMAAMMIPAGALRGASPASGLDSVQAIPDLVVTGTRDRTDVRHLSQTVSIVGRETIEHSMEPSLLPVLSAEVPGLFVTERGVLGYGSSGGSAGGISIRGLSGGNARMMVLIDGHPQYAGIFGHPISDSYQSLLADKVEVLRGPASVLYGSNAMGGVVNIVTRRMHGDGVRTHVGVGYGSYNTLETEVTNTVRKRGFNSVVSASYNRTDGHRKDMGFEQYGGYAKIGYDFSSHWQAFADVNVTHYNAHCPGPDYAPLVDGYQRITRGVASMVVSNEYDRTSGAVSFFYNWGNHRINDGYTPSNGQTSQDGRFKSYDDMIGVSAYQSTWFWQGNRITLGFDWFRYGGKARTDYVAGPQEGTRRDLVNKHEDEYAGYMDFRQDLWQWLSLNAGVRVDHHTRVGTEWVPQAGLAFHLPRTIELKASASKGFRYPILREMYMFPPQNPDLKPESMWNYEIAMSQQLLGGRLRYGVNLFYIDGKNLIVTLRNPNGTGMLNQNTGKVKNAGMELQGGYRISSAWRVNANYSYLHMKNPVIAAPEHKLYVGAEFMKGRWYAATGVQYVADLYTAVGDNPKKESYVLWNLRGQYRIAKWVDVWVRGDNLLAQKYEINDGYPMPRATVMAGFRFNF